MAETTKYHLEHLRIDTDTKWILFTSYTQYKIIVIKTNKEVLSSIDKHEVENWLRANAIMPKGHSTSTMIEAIARALTDLRRTPKL